MTDLPLLLSPPMVRAALREARVEALEEAASLLSSCALKKASALLDYRADVPTDFNPEVQVYRQAAAAIRTLNEGAVSYDLDSLEIITAKRAKRKAMKATVIEGGRQ